MTKPLPPGWRRIRLGEVLEQVNRFEQVKPGCEYRLLGVKWYANGCHLHTEILGHALKTKILSTVRADDITYNKMWTSKGAFGVVQPEQDGFVATSEYPLFISRDSALSPAFLSYVFRQRKFWVAARALCKGTTQRARLHPSDFLRLGIDLPPRSEQERIIAVLRAVDEAIKANEEVIARACDFKKALAHELLTRGLLGRHTHFKDSPIGRIPVEWEVKRLGEFADIQAGIALGKSRRPQNQAHPYLRVANVLMDRLDLSDVKLMEIPPDEYKRRQLKEGDVLMVEGHAQISQLGRATLVTADASGFSYQNHIFRVRPRENICVGRYLCLFVNGEPGRRYIEMVGKTTSGLNTVNSTKIREMPVTLPLLAEQRDICNIIDAFDKYLAREREAVAHLATVNSNLTQSLLVGF